VLHLIVIVCASDVQQKANYKCLCDVLFDTSIHRVDSCVHNRGGVEILGNFLLIEGLVRGTDVPTWLITYCRLLHHVFIFFFEKIRYCHFEENNLE